LARGPSPKLGAVLAALEKRGEHQKAEDLRRRVAERFKGVVSERELLALPVNDIVGTLDLFRQLFLETRKPRGLLERHVAELKHQGFTIVYGEKYGA
jgi:hypothetical protein